MDVSVLGTARSSGMWLPFGWVQRLKLDGSGEAPNSEGAVLGELRNTLDDFSGDPGAGTAEPAKDEGCQAGTMQEPAGPPPSRMNSSAGFYQLGTLGLLPGLSSAIEMVHGDSKVGQVFRELGLARIGFFYGQHPQSRAKMNI